MEKEEDQLDALAHSCPDALAHFADPTSTPTMDPALRWTPTPTWLCGGRVVAALPGSHALVLLVALKDSRSDISMQALHDSARMSIRVVE